MTIFDIALNDWMTIVIIVAQAGILYYRLKRVEQRAEKFNDLIVEFAVHKNSLEHHRIEVEKNNIRIENVLEKMDDRLSGIEAHAFKALVKNSHRGDL